MSSKHLKQPIKKRILKRRAKGIAIRAIAKEYNINEATLGDWLYFWKHGHKRQSEITRKSYRKKYEKPAKFKRTWSPEALEARRIATEKNKGKIQYIKKDDSNEDERNIRYICGLI